MQRSIEGLRVTPWADWSEWWELKELLSRGRVREANERVQCYLIRRRQAVPVAMITTVNLRYQLDYPSPDKYSQRLGLAMALVRFVNGMTDRLQPRGENAHAKSVHGLSIDLGLPLILVEIRHQASHNTMPHLSALESGARKALEWLDNFYWKVQHEKIHHQIGRNPNILRNVFSPVSVPRISSSEDTPMKQVMADDNDTDIRKADNSSVLKDLKKLAQRFGERRRQQSSLAILEHENSEDLTEQWVECKDSEAWKRMPIGLIPGQTAAPRQRLMQSMYDDESTSQEYCSTETENEIADAVVASDTREDFENVNKRLGQRDIAMVDRMTFHYERLLRTV